MVNNLNILMICVDHWPSALLGSNGHKVIKTPTLDYFVDHGIIFNNAYSECPVCIPARRSMMTGLSPRNHGDRSYIERMPMPNVPTMAQVFRNNGYQAYAVGKMHVYPQRNRIGFDDVILAEEGRYQFGNTDDYQVWLNENGYSGLEFAHGMSSNEYLSRPWHLPEQAHKTNWATRQMAKYVRRKDPGRPAFFYISYQYPHPPLVPIPAYLDMYEKNEIDEPNISADWIDSDNFVIKNRQISGRKMSKKFILDARRAFYAQCTYIDHQIRLIIGTLREEKLLDKTIILFTSDHGDMLGNHYLWQKRLFYEYSSNVPMILSGSCLDYNDFLDERLIGQTDIMPTLLELCNINTVSYTHLTLPTIYSV